MQNVEMIEASIFAVAMLALAVSTGLLIRSWRVYRLAILRGRCEAVRKLGWLRVRNEAGRVLIVAGVAYAGWVQASSPPPDVVTTNRGIFQAIWLGIAFICLTKSVLNERDNHRIVSIIERERAAGRMLGNAEGRVEERARAEAEKDPTP